MGFVSPTHFATESEARSSPASHVDRWLSLTALTEPPMVGVMEPADSKRNAHFANPGRNPGTAKSSRALRGREGAENTDGG